MLGYTKTKKKARQSKILVKHYTDCDCNAIEHIAYGLIQLYAWFAAKAAEYDAEKITAATRTVAAVINTETEYREVKAA
jgi:translation elongation factor EF-1beta